MIDVCNISLYLEIYARYTYIPPIQSNDNNKIVLSLAMQFPWPDVRHTLCTLMCVCGGLSIVPWCLFMFFLGRVCMKLRKFCVWLAAKQSLTVLCEFGKFM